MNVTVYIDHKSSWSSIMKIINVQQCIIASLFASFNIYINAAGITIVDWSGNYVGSGSSQNLNLGSSTDTSTTRTWEAAEITPGGTYEAPEGKTGPIFGAFEYTDNNGPRDFSLARIRRDDSNTPINFSAHGGVDSSNLKGLIYYTKSNFLNSMSSVPIGLTEMSGTLNVTDQSETAEYRFAVLNGTDWYLSSTTATDTGAFNIEDFGAINWGAWSMPEGSTFSATPSNYDVAGSTLTDVQAVGFYFDVSREGQSRVEFESFQVVAIPEPGTLLLVGIALGSLLLFRRKR